jgi:ADP-heptose:LPS heptosyltransferase
MRALFLVPGDGVSQLQALPAAAATAQQLDFALQVVCEPEVAGIWSLLPAVERVIPFSFGSASLADWANLLGAVRDPDFQACINLAGGLGMDLTLSMSHIPTRVAAAGFSATETVTPSAGGWPAQALEAFLRPIGVGLEAEAFRLSLPRRLIDEARQSLPAGSGPLLLMAAGGGPDDWPRARWQELPGRIRTSLSDLRCQEVMAAAAAREPLLQRAGLVAASDVVLSSDPLTSELALLLGVPVVALGRPQASLPARAGVKGLGEEGGAAAVTTEAALAALGLG